MSEPVNDIWKDPEVKAALKDGRSADDIAVLSCPECCRWGYYNQGSHFSCRFCNKTWACCTDDEEPSPGLPHIYIDGFTSLADTLTVTTEGYDNETITTLRNQNEKSNHTTPDCCSTNDSDSKRKQ